MGKFRAGVFTVDATKAFADLQLEGGRASGGAGGGASGSFGGAAGGGGAGGAGPALGSPGEAALVIQRKVGTYIGGRWKIFTHHYSWRHSLSMFAALERSAMPCWAPATAV